VSETPSTDVQPAGNRPATRPPFEDGNLVALRHGAYSSRIVGARAEVVRAELAELVPGLADDPESGSLVALYCRAVAREEICHLAIEAGSLSPHVLEVIRKQFPAMLQPGNVSPRLIESASAAARVAKELGDSLGIGPLASAQLREVRSKAALNIAALLQQAPSIMAAIAKALRATGLEEHSERFTAALDAALVEVMQQDD
jgi:hypothetical protein